MITIEIREKFSRLKNGGFDRQTHDSYAYDVVLVNDAREKNPETERREIMLQKGDFVIMIPSRRHEKQLAIDVAYRFARDVAEVIAPRGMVPTYFIEFDLKGHRASALAALTEEQKAALGL